MPPITVAAPTINPAWSRVALVYRKRYVGYQSARPPPVVREEGEREGGREGGCEREGEGRRERGREGGRNGGVMQ